MKQLLGTPSKRRIINYQFMITVYLPRTFTHAYSGTEHSKALRLVSMNPQQASIGYGIHEEVFNNCDPQIKYISTQAPVY